MQWEVVLYVWTIGTERCLLCLVLDFRRRSGFGDLKECFVMFWDKHSVRVEGAKPLGVLKSIKRTLKSVLKVIRSQCSDAGIGVMWFSLFGPLRISCQHLCVAILTVSKEEKCSY